MSEALKNVESNIIMVTVTGRCSREDWQMSVSLTSYRFRLEGERVSLERDIRNRFWIHNDSLHGGKANISFSQVIHASLI